MNEYDDGDVLSSQEFTSVYEYHLTPSVESECFPYFLTNEFSNRSATRTFVRASVAYSLL